MIRIGQKIDDFEFQVYRREEIEKVKLSTYKGKWVILLFYRADFSFICPADLTETGRYYDRFKMGGAEILSVRMDKDFAHKGWLDSFPSVKKIACPKPIDPTTKDCRNFRPYIEERGLRSCGSVIIDPNGILKARSFATKRLLKSNAEAPKD